MRNNANRPAYRDHISAGITAATNRDGKRTVVVHQYLFRALRRYTRTIETEKDGIRYFLDSADEGVGLRVFIDGAFEENQMDDILRLLKDGTGRTIDGATFVDVGANIGTTTALATKRYGAAHVIAFEPEPRNFELLQMLVLANGLTGTVECYPVALSNANGDATMELSRVNAGDNRIRVGMPGAGADGEEDWRTASVRLAQLDDFDIDYSSVSLVWMDVQGHEGHVLAGSRRLLSSEVPVITEYDPYMLARAGGLDLFHSIVETNFRTVIDARTKNRLSASDARKLASTYDSPRSFTDLLLLH